MTKERHVMLKLTDQHGVTKVNNKGKFHNLFLDYGTESLKHFWQAKRSLRKLKRQVYFTQHNILKISADRFPGFPQAITAISSLSQANRSNKHETHWSRQVSALNETFGKTLSRSSADFFVCGTKPGVFLSVRRALPPSRRTPGAGQRRRAGPGPGPPSGGRRTEGWCCHLEPRPRTCGAPSPAGPDGCG